MDLVSDPAVKRWLNVLAPVMAELSWPLSLDTLAGAVESVVSAPIVLETLPNGIGPEVSGLSLAFDGEIQIYHPAGPEWIRLVIVCRHLSHLLLHRPENHRGSAEPPICLCDDQDGEFLGILLVDLIERFLAGREGVLPEDATTLTAQLDLLTPLWARIVGGSPMAVPWPEPLRLGVDDVSPKVFPGGRVIPQRSVADQARLRWRRQRIITEIYDARRILNTLIPSLLPALALEEVVHEGLSGEVALAAADAVCLEYALAARLAGVAGRPDFQEPSLPGNTPSAAATRAAEWERLIRLDGVQQVITIVSGRLARTTPAQQLS